ncbi:MAG: AAA family ATPase [Phycisphaerales bacterium]|nr:MAG: AAA family ATPase [Phycisphaerales bacterium]
MQEILGQPQALKSLRAALDSGRVHHAWIFSGPRGVGKFTTALALAKILLDPDAGPNLAGEFESDPDSRTARLIDTGTHPDLHVIHKELALYSDNPQLRTRKLLNIPLDLLRERMLGGKTGDDRQHEATAYRTAALGHGKVFIIDEAELLDQYSQNSLLKTLEEPPAETYIFLITSRPERLFATILSRCQHVRFGPLEEDALHEWFERANLEVGERERAWIEDYCAGSPGLALLAAEYGFHHWWETLEPMLAELECGRFPDAMGETLAKLVDDFAQRWVKNHVNASKDAANKDGLGNLLALLATHARRSLHESCGGNGDADYWLQVIDLIRHAEQQADANVNLKQLLENLAVQWTHVAPQHSGV